MVNLWLYTFNDISFIARMSMSIKITLHKSCLFLNEKSYLVTLRNVLFFTYAVTSLGYIITGDSIKADESKIEALWSWPIPQSIHDVRSLHGLVTF